MHGNTRLRTSAWVSAVAAVMAGVGTIGSAFAASNT